MKTFRTVFSISTAAFVVAATSVIAGPGPQYWQQQTERARARAQKEVPSTQLAPDANGMACSVCKTETVREFSSGLPNGKGTPRWNDLGTKHSCAHCGGEIFLMKGQGKDSMSGNCAMCGTDAALCRLAISRGAKA